MGEKYLLVFNDGDEFIIDDYKMYGDSLSYFMNGAWRHGLEMGGREDDGVRAIRPIPSSE